MRTNRNCVIALIVYVLIVFYIAVLSRDTLVNTKDIIRLDLLRGFFNATKDYDGDILRNIFCFIPIGIITSIVTKRNRILKALLFGFLFSLAIESSQLIWKKGVFDVVDLFNNSVGALIGGLFVLLVNRMIKWKKLGVING